MTECKCEANLRVEIKSNFTVFNKLGIIITQNHYYFRCPRCRDITSIWIKKTPIIGVSKNVWSSKKGIHL